jgi:hypothetical protein
LIKTMSTATARSRTSRRDEGQSLRLPVVGLVAAIALIVVGLLLASRRTGALPTVYGKRRGNEAANSVNGTAVLADLFKRSGHRVTTMTRLSPKVNDSDVVVWVPNSFKSPTKEQRQFLEDFLADGAGKTVIYVGRDYDAAVAYWADIATKVPPRQADEFLRRQAEARATHEATRAKMPVKEYARWFTARRDARPRTVRTLEGPWAADVDPAKAEIHLEGRLDIPSSTDRVATDPDIPENFENLLSSSGDSLVTRITDDEEWGDGQMIVVANGSFVLNYPLVNHEHRKLAVKLVNECGAPGRVVFIESGPEGPAVLDKEPTAGEGPLGLLKVWPLNAILMHLTLLGIIFCLARSPIFGRPKELPEPPTADFGKHVAALGELLGRTKDQAYAHQRLVQYRQLAQRKSGRSHRKG